MNRHPSWPQGSGERLAILFAFSLVLHLLALLLADRFIDFSEEARPSRPISVTTRQMSRKEWKENLTPREVRPRPMQARQTPEQQKPEQEQVKEKEPPKPEETPLNGQVVDLAPPRQEETPDETKYLSSYNTRTQKETKSKYQAVYEQAAPKPSAIGLKTQAARQAHEAQERQEERQALVLGEKQPLTAQTQEPTDSQLRLRIPKQEASSPLETFEGGNRPVSPNQTSQVKVDGRDRTMDVHIPLVKQGDNAGENRTPQQPSPALSQEELLMFSLAGGPMADYLEDVEEGDETSLNSKAFKYAGFFNRIKAEVARNWHPAQVHKRYDPTFSIYGYQDRRTVLYLTMDPQGNLEKAEVMETSGVDFLDDEAIAAFFRASPFANPPEGLVNERGKVAFAFGFYFQISSVRFRPAGGGF